MRAAFMPPDQAHEQNIQDPHRVVQCRAAPDTLWAQHHNGIFVSRDGARSWQEIPEAGPSVFGFAVAVHPQQFCCPGTHCRLPPPHAYDLVYRHALGVDASGERLAMASTSGNLWLSENGGDDWQCLSTHLPPVSALAFD